MVDDSKSVFNQLILDLNEANFRFDNDRVEILLSKLFRLLDTEACKGKVKSVCNQLLTLLPNDWSYAEKVRSYMKRNVGKHYLMPKLFASAFLIQ
ncbi:MAG: hypothetical protein V3575_03335 [Candidatus Absconditabacteria bacterium]